MSWRYNFTFKLTRSGLGMIVNFLESRGYVILEQNNSYMILSTQISNLHKTAFRDNITSLLIREEEV